MTHRVTDTLALAVESMGMEMSVTLIVQGTPVVGILTSIVRNGEYIKQRLALSGLVSGPMEIVTEAPTESEQEEIRASWQNQHQFDAEYTFDTVCLRNAVIRAGPQDSWTPCPYLLVNADMVSAIALGDCVYGPPMPQ